MTLYPAICAQVTATFAVLSKTINAVRAHPQNDKQLNSFLSQLQAQEKDKLNYTAALHLEQIRQSGGGDSTTQDMYQSSIQSLRQRIAHNVERINEIIEELRCILLEERS